jgi:hypothetical protein
MFTVRNLGGIALFLFGTTFLWLTPAFASKDVSTDGVLWAITRVMALATLAGFLVATWGLFQRDSWWEAVAVGSAMLGLLTLVPFWIAAAKSGETTPAFTVFVAFLGIAGVLVLLLVPKLEHWVDSHVMGS